MDEARLRGLLAEVPEEYRGPWMWSGYVKGPIMLSTVNHGRMYVMGFTRQGMGGAQPLFPVYEDQWPVMRKASGLAVREVEYRDDIVAIDNFAARWIAACSPATVAALLAEIDRLRSTGEDD